MKLDGAALNKKGEEYEDSGDLEQAFNCYLEAASVGSVDAMTNIGRMYLTMDEYADAARWYKKAVENGGAHAAYCLGVLYDGGLGVPQDDKLAAQNYRFAADKGHIKAYLSLAACYEEGKGVVKDLKEALRMYTRASSFSPEAAAKVKELTPKATPTVSKPVSTVKQSTTTTPRTTPVAKPTTTPPKQTTSASYVKPVAKPTTTPPKQTTSASYTKPAANVQQPKQPVSATTQQPKQSTPATPKVDIPSWASGSTLLDMGISAYDKEDYSTSLAYFNAALKKGMYDALGYIGECYVNGWGGLKKSKGRAFELFSEGAEKGSGLCMYRLGVCYEFGWGIGGVWEHEDEDIGADESDYEQAVVWYKKAIDKSGEPRALVALACLYHRGDGVERNKYNEDKLDKEAFEMYCRAERKGYVPAIYFVASCYEDGKGVKQDAHMAYTWYKRAAEKGDSGAMFRLGRLDYTGALGGKYLSSAIDWYRKAAAAGNDKAMNNLGVLYANGEGVPKDVKKAAELYLMAAKKGNWAAQGNIASCYEEGRGVPKDAFQAVVWYNTAVRMHDPFSCYKLGIFYEDGFAAGGVKQDVKQAIEYYKWAALLGHYPEASFRLGYIYSTGKGGVPKDRDEAISNYKDAANAGHRKAIHNLWLIYYKLCDRRMYSYLGDRDEMANLAKRKGVPIHYSDSEWPHD